MTDKFKFSLAVMIGAIAASLPVVLSGAASDLAITPDNLPLTKLAENNRTITYG